ncbi:MAG: ABC transporter substrate-binding protein [Geminicoccaceae bacterium]
MRQTLRLGAAMLALAAGTFVNAPAASAEETLRVVMHSDLKIVDPIWTTAYMSRNYGYMVYDTLLALDENVEVQLQMAQDWAVSDDNLVHTVTLRDGLKFHDGAPVTSADAIASIMRWGEKDAMGQKLMDFVAEMVAVDDRTFEIRLSEPYGLVQLSLAKPSSNVPFIMPERIANTPSGEQISEYVGSGPFIFKADEWEPGNKAVFEKFDDYVPREEPASWSSGGKIAKVDRVEWISMPDHQTAVNALIAGEIDIIEQPPHDLLPILEASDDIVIEQTNLLGSQYMFRLNHLHPPFDNVKVRRAALAALNQKAFLDGVIGNPDYYRECPAMFVCDTTFATDAGADIIMKSDFELSKKLLEEAGYDGTPVTLMHSTDLQALTNLAPVAAQLLRQGGFTVDMQSMDWQTLVSRRSKKEPPAEGGWNAFLTAWVAADVMNPMSTAGLKANCDDAWFGWPCDEELESLRDQFSRETDTGKQKALAEAIQVRALEIGTHMHAGQYFVPMAYRKNISGILKGPVPYLWNVAKGG